MQGEEVSHGQSLVKGDQLHAQGQGLGFTGIRVICHHSGKAQTLASPGHLTADLWHSICQQLQMLVLCILLGFVLLE